MMMMISIKKNRGMNEIYREEKSREREREDIIVGVGGMNEMNE